MRRQRNSSIELLKLIAVLMIVINHITMSISKVPDIGIVIGTATADIQTMLLTIFRHFGAIGNAIFIVCSSWFLVDSNIVDKRKILHMIVEVWCISIIILAIAFLMGIHPSYGGILRSIFPTIFSNNWFITCYMIVYALHGALNHLIDNLSKKKLLRICLLLVIIYCGFGTLSSSLLYYSHLMMFLTLYMLVGYVKKHLKDFCSNIRVNVIFLVSSVLSLILLIIITNILGLHIPFFKRRSLVFAKTGNPLIILVALSVFNLANSRKLSSSLINFLSSHSMLIYLLHEHWIVRNYFRPLIWVKIITRFGAEKIVFFDLVYSTGLFVVAMIISTLYKICLRKYLYKFCNICYCYIGSVYSKIEEMVIRLS